MTGYHGEQTVKGGFYLNHSALEFEAIAREGGILTGDKGVRYSRLPLPVMMVVGPLVGLIFVILLPLVGIIGIVGLFIFRVSQSVRLARRKAT